jgi:hypothetical protein
MNCPTNHSKMPQMLRVPRNVDSVDYFGDGMGPTREAYFRKVHEGHDGLHRYRTRQITSSCNEITKWWWVANHWVEEARFFRIRASPLTLIDYEPAEFQKLLRGQHANFKRTHTLAYQGPSYAPGWGEHTLTVTMEAKPNLGAGYVYKNARSHQSRLFGECSYSWIDNHPIRVFRQSLSMR